MLNQASLNPAQAWALQYWIYMDRRTQLDDKRGELELQTFNLSPERWGEIYREQLLSGIQTPGDIGQAFDGEAELPVTDIADINDWYESRSNTRRVGGGEASRHDEMSHLLGFAEGEGRRV